MGLETRLANAEDSKEIYEWRNDERTRLMSHTSKLVKWDGHVKWFDAALNNPNRCLLICFLKQENIKVAIVRFDVEREKALVSINTSPSMRGKGMSKICLNKSIIYFASLFKDVRQINAEIKTNNVASRKAFEGVGFDLVKVDDEVGFFKFEL